MTNKMTKSKC